MTGALAILFLLAVTLVIVRVAGVALRLTGLPTPVARFQAVSTLTGTGFTTSEAEGMMHHPVRRRILMILMFTGHLGLVSLTSTVILALAASESSSGVVIQILAMLGAIAIIYALSASETLDRIMCDWVQVMLEKLHWATDYPYEVLFEHSDEYQLCEHVVDHQKTVGVGLSIVSHNGSLRTEGGSPSLSKGDIVVLYGKPEDHLSWGGGQKDGDAATGSEPLSASKT